jgi:hypothetical protein
LSVIGAFCRAAHGRLRDGRHRRPLTAGHGAAAYNRRMSSSTLLLVRGLVLAALALPLAGVVHAQSAPPPGAGQPAQAAEAPESPRRNQKIEHIRVEDAGARVDEVRYGGQTQSITVQPKANVPSYEVLPNYGGRDRQGPSETGGNGNGPRVWNVLKF